MKRLLTYVAVTLFLAAGTLTAHGGPVVYNQPSDFPGGGAFASQNDINPGGYGGFATMYDNFTLNVATPVTDVHWQGGYWNPAIQGNIAAFQIGFWADNAGQPGALLYNAVIPGNAGENFVGIDLGGFPTFNYDADLPSPFLAQANTQYWLSIVPDMAFPPQWGWHTGIGGDGQSVQDFFGARTVISSDLAFSLTVPEPSSLALLSLGGLALACWRRSRQRV
jgi:hypothetical protein